MVSFLRCHLRASRERSSCSIAFRPALPISISLFFFGLPISYPSGTAILHARALLLPRNYPNDAIMNCNVYKSFVGSSMLFRRLYKNFLDENKKLPQDGMITRMANYIESACCLCKSNPAQDHLRSLDNSSHHLCSLLPPLRKIRLTWQVIILNSIAAINKSNNSQRMDMVANLKNLADSRLIVSER